MSTGRGIGRPIPNDQKRVHDAVIHIDVRGDRVWFQHDGTSTGVANDLIARGVPEEHIVLAFHPPKARLTG